MYTPVAVVVVQAAAAVAVVQVQVRVLALAGVPVGINRLILASYMYRHISHIYNYA